MVDCCSSSVYDAKHSQKPFAQPAGPSVRKRPRAPSPTTSGNSWKWRATAERFYFCGTPDCDAVYFGNDGSVLPKSMLRTRVVAKEQDGDALLCHCFGVTKADFEREPSAKDFVVEQTKAGRCSCETSNPSGRCCLKDFPKPRG